MRITTCCGAETSMSRCGYPVTDCWTHCTVSCTVVLWVSAPELPLILMV